jgi:hypothetical protein
VNRYAVPAGAFALGLRAGHHTIVVERAGYLSATWELALDPGARVEKQIDLRASNPPAPPAATAPDAPRPLAPRIEPARGAPTAAPYVAVGIAGAFVTAAVVTGALSLDRRARFDDANDGSDPDRAEELRGEQRTLTIATDVLAAGAVVAAGVGVYLFWRRPSSPKPSRVATAIAIGPRGMAVTLVR